MNLGFLKRDEAAESRPDNGKRPLLALPHDVVYVHSFATTALLVLAGIGCLYLARDVFVPIVIASVLYLVLAPIQHMLDRLGVPSSLGAAAIVLGVLAALAAGGYYLSTPVAGWFARMPEMLVEARDKIEALRRPVEEVRKASEQVEKMTEVAPAAGAPPNVVVKDASLQEQLLDSVVSIGVRLVLIFVLLYFLLATGTIFREKLVRVMPTFGDKKRAVAITNEIQKQVSRYLLTISVINLCLGAAVGTALHFAGMPSAVLWGAMAAILNFIPYIGAVIGVSVTGLVALVSLEPLSQAIVPPLAYLALTALEGQIVTPSILGRRLTLNPLVIFVMVVFWGWLWGAAGALLAVPMLVVLKAMCDNLERWAAFGEFLSGRRD